MKAKIITGHDFKSFSPHELHQSDHPVSSLFNILSESRKNKRDDPRLVNTRISKMQKVNSVNYGVSSLTVQAVNNSRRNDWFRSSGDRRSGLPPAEWFTKKKIMFNLCSFGKGLLSKCRF